MAEAPGREFLDHNSKFHFQQLASVYGSHLPFRLLMERNLAAQQQRLCGLPASNLSLDVLTGRALELPFPGYLHSEPEQLPVLRAKPAGLE